MRIINRIICFVLLLPLLFSCFRKKEAPFEVTYKVNGYSEGSYAVTIHYTDSTGKGTWVCTTKRHWTKTVRLPKGSSASLLACSLHDEGKNRRDWERGAFREFWENAKVSYSAKIVFDGEVVEEESGRSVSLVFLPR